MGTIFVLVIAYFVISFVWEKVGPSAGATLLAIGAIMVFPRIAFLVVLILSLYIMLRLLKRFIRVFS